MGVGAGAGAAIVAAATADAILGAEASPCPDAGPAGGWLGSFDVPSFDPGPDAGPCPCAGPSFGLELSLELWLAFTLVFPFLPCSLLLLLLFPRLWCGSEGWPKALVLALVSLLFFDVTVSHSSVSPPPPPPLVLPATPLLPPRPLVVVGKGFLAGGWGWLPPPPPPPPPR